MKIGILTYYGVHNHGAVLQANALKTVLLNKGHECGFLEFERSYSNISHEQANKYRLGLGSIPFYVKYLKQKGVGNIWYNFRKKRTLSGFRKNYIPMIGNYKDFNGDLVLIGSDEVFSLEIGVNPQLYGNGLKAKHVASYAGCFGPTTIKEINDQHQEKMIATGLKNMDAVSVRDMNSMTTVKDVSGIEATLVCDPVILYGYEKEMQEFKPKYKDYILIYSYDKNMNDAKEYEPIKAYAKKHGFTVYSIGYHHRWCKCIDASPIELLGWIKNANLVVTDTFHGSVMSIICNTSMVVKLRGNQNKLRFLLSEYGMLDRIIEDFSKLEEIADMTVDFELVNSLIQERRIVSMRFLENILNNIC